MTIPTDGRQAVLWVALLVGFALCLGVSPASSQPVKVDIPTLPAGKSTTITFDATINSPFPLGVPSVSTQGQVTGKVGGVPFPPVLTDDPDTPAPNDPSGAGATATLQLEARMREARPLTNLATKTAHDQPDPNPANDQSGVQVVGQPVADLTLTVATEGASVVPGTTVTYTLTVTNHGPSRATDVVVTDTLPAGVTLVTVTPGAFLCTVTGATVTCTLGSLEPGAHAVVTLTGTVTTAGRITNTASVRARETDPQAENNPMTVATTSNTPPVALEDVGTTLVDIPLTISVLDNDRDADGDALTVTSVTTPVNGMAVRQPDGTVTYTPRAAFVGTDTFLYTISDGHGGTATALVTVIITAEGDIVTPQEDEVIAGDAVTLATFNLPTPPTVQSVRALTTRRIPTDTVAVLFQYQPVGTAVWHDIGEALTPPFFHVSWDTTQLPDGAYLVRAITRRATGPPETSQPVRIRINNSATGEPPDIVETPTFRMQRLLALRDNIVVTSAGVIAVLPAGTLPADDEIIIDMPAVAQVPGPRPGEVAAPLVRLILTSGQKTLRTPCTIFFPYADANHDGRVDGTTLDATTLTLWFFDEGSRTWMRLVNAVVRPDFKAIEARVNRPGLFGIFHVASAPSVGLAPLTIGLGEHSPTATATVQVSARTGALPVLHVRLDTGAERVSLTEAMVAFAAPLGNHQAVERLQVQMVHDVNGNGQLDANEPILAAAMVHSVLDPITLTFSAPLDLPPQAATYVLVALQMGGNGAGTRGVAPRRTGWLLLSPVIFALTLLPWRRRLAPWIGLGVVLVMCSLALTSCQGEHADLTAVVTMPAQSVRAQGAVSGPLSGPETPSSVLRSSSRRSAPCCSCAVACCRLVAQPARWLALSGMQLAN